MIALYHDDPEVTPSDKLRSDAALSLPGRAPSPSGLIEQHIPAGRYAKAIHKGGYEGLPAAWAALKNEWLPKSGHKMGHPSYEIYLNNPMTTEKKPTARPLPRKRGRRCSIGTPAERRRTLREAPNSLLIRGGFLNWDEAPPRLPEAARATAIPAG